MDLLLLSGGKKREFGIVKRTDAIRLRNESVDVPQKSHRHLEELAFWKAKGQYWTIL